MTLFAQLDANIVTGTLEASEMPTDLPAGRTFIELDEPVPHFSTYDTGTKTFTSPPAVADTLVALVDRAVDAALDLFDIAGLKPADVVAAKAAGLTAAKRR